MQFATEKMEKFDDHTSLSEITEYDADLGGILVCVAF